MRGQSIAWVVVLMAGCSDAAPVSVTTDAGGDAGPGVAPSIPWLAEGVPPIAAPSAPFCTPCPVGWREARASADDVATCEPFAESGPEVCAEGLAHFPGGARCEAVGNACPSGEWSDALPAAGVLYVRAGAAAGGDGSRATPFGRIGDAMAVADTGTIVALSRGRWDEAVVMRAGVTLQGACAAETVLTSSVAGELEYVVLVEVGGAVLRDVRIDGAARRGLGVREATGELVADGVIVSGVREVGVAVGRSARLTATRLVVRDTRSRETDRLLGHGLEAQSGAVVSVTRALVERNLEVAVLATGMGTQLMLADVVVRDTRSDESDRLDGRGLQVQLGANAAVARALFERNRTVAIYVADVGSTLTLDHAVVRDTQSQELDGDGGRAVSVHRGAVARASCVLFDHNREAAVVALDSMTHVGLDDVVVRDTRARQSDGMAGFGATAQDGATAQVTRGLFERNRHGTISSVRAGSSVRLVDVVVRDTMSRESDLAGGFAVTAETGGAVQVTRGVFERNRTVAILGAGVDTRVTLEDVVVRDTAGQEADGALGRGLDAQDGASVEVTRALFERNRDLAVVALSDDTRVTLADVVVRDTTPAACGDACVPAPFGTGVASYVRATLSMSRFVIARASLCGVHVAEGAQLDLADGVVRESEIGACIQVPGYAIARLATGVQYVENDRNLETTELPVPSVSPPLGGL